MKKALIVANIVFASINVFGMDSFPLNKDDYSENNVNKVISKKINYGKVLKSLTHFAAGKNDDYSKKIQSYNTSPDEIRQYLSEIDREAARGKDDLEGSWLITAIQFKCDGIVKYLIDYGADVNLKDRYGYTPISTALQSDNVGALDYLMKHGANIDYTGIFFNYIATHSKHFADIARCLTQHDVNLNLVDSSGDTLLSGAVCLGDIDLINYLIKHGADVNWISKGKRQRGVNLICIALNNENLEILRCLIEHKAPLINNSLLTAIEEEKFDAAKLICNYVNGYEKDKALLLVKEKENEGMVQYLIEHGAYDFTGINFEQALKKGNEFAKRYLICSAPATIFANSNKEKDFKKFCKESGGVDWLITAVQYDNLEIVKFLVENGADVNWEKCEIVTSNYNERFEYKNTVLSAAVKRNNSEMVRYLLDKGAIADNSQDKSGDTLLHIAIKNKNPNIVSDLINQGADVNAENKRFETPLAAALQSDNETIISILLDNGAKLKSTGGTLTFEDAIDEANISIVKYFLKQGIDINKVLKNGETPLAKAIGKENIELFKLLIENGADVNQACGKDLDTPLHYVLYANDQDKAKEMVNFLLKKGAHVNRTNSQGETPISLADDFFGESSVITKILYSPGAKR